MNNYWNNNKELCSIINDCIKIEKNIYDINIINEKIKKYNSFKIEIKFKPEEIEINEFLKTIKSFGSIYNNSINIEEEEKKSKNL